MVAKFVAITPGPLGVPEMLREMQRGLDNVKKNIIKLYEETSETWEHKPKFYCVRRPRRLTRNTLNVQMRFGTDDQVWNWLDQGTRPHAIYPKKVGGTLAFPSTYRAKTTPNRLRSSGGGSSGPTIFAKGVQHPGTKARRWSKLIASRGQAIVKREMEQAVFRARAGSGFAI